MSEPPKRLFAVPFLRKEGWDGEIEAFAKRRWHPAESDEVEYVLATDHARLVEALAVAREALEAVGDRMPATCELTLAHEMAQIAGDALARIDALQQPQA